MSVSIEKKNIRTYILACIVFASILFIISHRRDSEAALNRNGLFEYRGTTDTRKSVGKHYGFSSDFRRLHSENNNDETLKAAAEQPGGADWRTILKDIQEKRKLEREQEKEKGDEDTSVHEQKQQQQQNHQMPAQNINRRNRRRQREQAYNKKFGRFRREFMPDRSIYHEYPDSNRFESDETWRPPEVFPDSNHVKRTDKPLSIEELNQDLTAGSSNDGPRQQQALRKVTMISKAEHIQQNLAKDFGKNADRIFLMLKTGYTVQWDRIPMHLLTTLTKFPNFGIYSDAASSIAGYEIMDILADLPESILSNPQLDLYTQQKKQRRNHTPNLSGSLNGGTNSLVNSQAWIMDKFKNLPILKHAWENSPDQDWYIMIDDDTFVFADNLGRWLSTLDPNKPYYLGSAVAGLNHIFAHGGSGIVLSRGLMKMAFQNPKTDAWMTEYAERALKECCGDFVLAAFLKEKLNIDLNLSVSGKRFQGEPITKVACHKQNWCAEIVTFHHTTPRDMELLWEYERIRSYYTTKNLRGSYVFAPSDGPILHENPPITYADIYTDFMKPYLKPMRKNWDNNAKEFQFSWSMDYLAQKATIEDYLRNDGYSDKPYTSVDQCRKACLKNPDCLMFRYDPYQKYCGYATSIALGNHVPLGAPGTTTHLNGDAEVAQLMKKNGIDSPRSSTQGLYSEWRFDRVEAMRASVSCDPEAQGDIPDVDDSKEGWYWHARDKMEGNIN